MTPKTILIVAGDPSGDLHGAHLIRALKAADADLFVAAVGGPLMRESSDEFLEDLASRGVTGFWEPVLKIGFLVRLGLRLKRFMIERKAAALVCIDYYGFNRRLLALAQSAGVRAYYYISPQVWASRAGRVPVLKRLVRRMFVIFPFEETLYRKAGLPCTFVGHPLLDLLPEPRKAAPTLSPPLKLGLLPGSRSTEVKRHLPVMLEGLKTLRRHFPSIKACLFASPALGDSAYAAASRKGVELVRESDYSRRAALDLAFCSSGTATLENALLGVPMVVIYKLSWPTYLIARAIIKVPHIAMANLLAGRALVPELIQREATGAKLAAAAVALLEDPRRYAALKKELLSLREVLGGRGAANRAAAEILSELGARPAVRT
ncbi:MAG: lipid-A-disaccharide synthase [Elusimicrobia bacterium]|nr:lipid-A-disaccharide synthase [Elusimicrobiota bacterium]